MAALVDRSIPEITRQLSDPEPDVVVKSKPLPISTLLNEEEEEDEGTTEIEPDVVVKSKPLQLVDAHRGGDTNDAAVIDVTEERQNDDTSGPPRQSTTTVSGSHGSSEGQTRKLNGDVGVNKVAPSQAIAESIEQVGVKKVGGLDDSTAVVLRRYTASKNGRHAQIPITSMGEIGGSIPLCDSFRVAGRSCTVRLEEDYISWVSTGKKEGEFVR